MVLPGPRTSQRTIALLIETSSSYARGVLGGVIQYTREHTPWSTYWPAQRRGEPTADWLSSWRGDGLIARMTSGQVAERVAASGLPAVGVSAANLLPSMPWVASDDAAVAAAAYQHLADRGFRHFAFCGDPRFDWSNRRQQHFLRLARDAGHTCEAFPCEEAHGAGDRWASQAGQLGAWVAGLPKPVGVMACYDLVGREVLHACQRAGVAVPDDVAVIGVDNDEQLCELSDPPLSSVIVDAKRTGYVAAALLDDLMSGRLVEPRGHLIAPAGVAARRSSDVIAVDDPDVAGALRFIRDHACRGIDVADVLEVVPIARRVMDARFKKLFGRTPRQEIDRVRLNRVKELLRETNLNVGDITQKVGLRQVEYFSVWFKRATGLAPSEYRRKYREKWSAPSGEKAHAICANSHS